MLTDCITLIYSRRLLPECASLATGSSDFMLKAEISLSSGSHLEHKLTFSWCFIGTVRGRLVNTLCCCCHAVSSWWGNINDFELFPIGYECWILLLRASHTDVCRESLFLTTRISFQSLPVINPQSCYYYGAISDNDSEIEAPVTCSMKP